MNDVPWRRTIELAGVRFAVECDGIAADRLDQRFGHFFADPAGAADVMLTVVAADVHRSIEQPASSEYPACEVIVTSTGAISYQRNGFRMQFDPSSKVATAIASPSPKDLPIDDDPTPLDTPLRLLLSYLLVQRDGFLIHASGFGDRRGAVIFAGVSGAGKTTSARKFPYENVLSDDQVAVRRIGARWMAFSLPFVGEYRRAPLRQETPLKRIFLLRKGGADAQVRSIHRAVATARLLACVPWFVRTATPPQLLSLVADVACNVAIADLEVARDAPLCGLIEQVLTCESA